MKIMCISDIHGNIECLNKAIERYREENAEKLINEKEKRMKIGEFSNSFADKCIITTDNPRFEEPLDIINDITNNMTNKPIIIENRKEAIICGLNKLDSNDCLLILGKGAEDYIEVKGTKYKYMDMEESHKFEMSVVREPTEKKDGIYRYSCICGYEYDEELGIPEAGIAPGTKFEDLPEDFECPLCGAGKEVFEEA